MKYTLYATDATSDITDPLPGITYTDYHALSTDTQSVIYLGTRLSNGVWLDCEPDNLCLVRARKVGECEGFKREKMMEIINVST